MEGKGTQMKEERDTLTQFHSQNPINKLLNIAACVLLWKEYSMEIVTPFRNLPTELKHRNAIKIFNARTS